MRRSTPTRDSHPSPLRGALLALCLLFAAGTVVAQDPIPTAADPDMAEQETYGLVVKVSGSNFTADSEVDFLVTGTEDTGGITVKNVKRRNPKTLEVTIDVAPDAQFEKKFDIRVRSNNGRTGKGTELFRVLEKATGGGGDTTPPGDVLDLDALEAEIGFNSVTFHWTAPADDGYDSMSGPAAGYLLRLRSDGPFTLENWDEAPNVWSQAPQTPGSRESAYVGYLLPETTYWVALRTSDDAPNGGNWSGISNYFSFRTIAAPVSNWVEEFVDTCDPWPQESQAYLQPIDLEFDLDDRPAILYDKRCAPLGTEPTLVYLARWTGNAWSRAVLPEELYSGNSSQDLEFEPGTGVATIANGAGELRLYRETGSGWSFESIERRGAVYSSLAYANGEPWVAYMLSSKGKLSVKIAHRSAGGWTSIGFQPSSAIAHLAGLVFDANGHPGVAYRQDLNGDGHADSLRFSLWNGSSWSHETVEAVTGNSQTGLFATLAWDPSRARFSIAHTWGPMDLQQPSEVLFRVCDRLHGPPVSWSCSTVATPADGGELEFDSDGAAWVAFTDWATLGVAARTEAGDWTPSEYVAWDTASNYELRLDPLTGLPVMAYFDGNGPYGAGSDDPTPVLVLARRLP